MKLKAALFIIISSVFFIEILQTEFTIFKIKKLKGEFQLLEEPVLTTSDFLSGRFQEELNAFHEEDLSLHPFFVRVRNQFSFWFYNKAHASNVVIGKENVLYQDFYIDSYLGKDFIGKEKISDHVSRFVEVQKRFKEQGKILLLVIAPGKVSIYPEYLPSKFSKEERKETNYEAFTKELSEKGALYFDTQKYLASLKSNSEYPLFPRTGTHWSGYAVTLISDSLFKMVERGSNFNLPDITTSKGILTDTALRFTDDDIGAAMNLLFPIKPYPMYYPEIRFEEKADSLKPNALFIGDSFTQSFIFFYPYFDKLFNKRSRFWYYNKVVSYPETVPDYTKNISELNLEQEILSRDVIILVSTEQNLKDFGFGFIENAEKMLTNGIVQKSKALDNLLAEINSSEEWLLKIREKAVAEGRSLEEQKILDALWLLRERKVISSEDEKTLKNMKKRTE